ncbi:MAG: SRPBCC family protein [Bacteroidota bacterium]
MKTITKILIAVAVLMAIPLVMALFISKDYSITREVVINKPKQDVFNYIKLLKNQDDYNIWVQMDPNMKKDFRGTDGTAGFVYAWDGNDKAGAGEQEIKSIVDGERMDVELRFKRPFESTGHAPFTTEAVNENQTKVTWNMNGVSGYPMNFMNLFMDGMLGKDMDASLGMLKANLEK